MAGLFDLQQLVNLLSIGTLLAYSVVAISITILRYTIQFVSTLRCLLTHLIRNWQVHGVGWGFGLWKRYSAVNRKLHAYISGYSSHL